MADTAAPNTGIRFLKYLVTDGTTRARVSYSHGHVFVRQSDGSNVLRDCITLYAQDYSRDLGRVLGDRYVNDTDSQTDYFDQGHARIFPGDPLYAAAKARADEWAAHWAARRVVHEARMEAQRATRLVRAGVPA